MLQKSSFNPAVIATTLALLLLLLAAALFWPQTTGAALDAAKAAIFQLVLRPDLFGFSAVFTGAARQQPRQYQAGGQ